MTQKELDSIFADPGLYVLTCTEMPGCTMAVVSGKDQHGKPVAYAMRTHYPLSPDAAAWPEIIKLGGGPFSVQSIDALKQAIENMRDELEFWKGAALDAQSSVMFERDMTPVGTAPHSKLQSLLDQVDEAQKAETIASQLVTQQPA
jgi:hypothetical protein